MHYDPAKRDASWHMFLPGLYVDPTGAGHVFPDEFIAWLQVQHPEVGFTFDDRDMIVKLASEILHREGINVRFLEHERSSQA